MPDWDGVSGSWLQSVAVLGGHVGNAVLGSELVDGTLLLSFKIICFRKEKKIEAAYNRAAVSGNTE